MTFGRVGNALFFFGLLGNPVSVMICFEKFAYLALQKMCGQAIEQPLKIKARLLSVIKKRPGRTEFQRGIISYDENQVLSVTTTGAKALVSSVQWQRLIGLIVLDSNDKSQSIGDFVTVEPFSRDIYGNHYGLVTQT